MFADVPSDLARRSRDRVRLQRQQCDGVTEPRQLRVDERSEDAFGDKPLGGDAHLSCPNNLIGRQIVDRDHCLAVDQQSLHRCPGGDLVETRAVVPIRMAEPTGQMRTLRAKVCVQFQYGRVKLLCNGRLPSARKPAEENAPSQGNCSARRVPVDSKRRIDRTK